MNPTETALYEALADAAASGCALSAEWGEHLARDPKLRGIAERFGQTTELLGGLRQRSAPRELEGRVVGALQAGHREDRVTEALRALSPRTAPPELEALVAEALPGVTHRKAPTELDDRIEALLSDWEGASEAQPRPMRPRLLRSRPALITLAAASLLFLVVLATPRESAHERARDALVATVPTISQGLLGTTGSLGEGLLAGVTGGLSDEDNLGRLKARGVKPGPGRRAALGGAGRGAGPTTHPGANGGTGSQAASAGGAASAGRTGADLLTKLAASSSAPHAGVRRIEFSEGPNSPFTLIYREEVSVDTQGRFAVEPIEVVQPQMSASSHDLFLVMQKSREGFFYRFRDFRIRDLALFTAQYAVVQGPTTIFVANYECVELDIRRTDGDAHRYLVWVEPTTGLCLKAEEYNLEGFLVGTLEYETLNLAPTFAAPLSGGPTAWTPVDGVAPPSQMLDPLWIPTGYALQATDMITDQMGIEWLRHSYSNGLELLFVLHDLRPAGSVPGSRLTGNALTRVWVHEVGSWGVAEGTAGDVHLMVLGKRPEADLVAVLASTVR